MNAPVNEPRPVAEEAPTPVSFGQALVFWLKLGFISFGGPAGQIALLHQELVDNRRWISERRFLHALNYCMVLPGPEAQQLVTYLGWLMHKTLGGVVAGVLFVLPSLLLLMALSWMYVVFADQPVVSGLLFGIKPAITALVLQAAIRMGRRVLTQPLMWLIAVAAFVGVAVLNWPFPLIVLGAAALGWWGARRWPGQVNAHPVAKASAQAHRPALIDDHTPLPEHAQFQTSRLLGVLIVGLLLWGLPLGGVAWINGWSHPLTQMGWFFTKAALMTFGGAYAVLPYVHQAAVLHYGWLSATQMMDGLALGESTPGPLIMVVAFVGFLGGHQAAFLGPEHAVAAGALAAAWVTWFTFLPSFLFILAGGPWVERTREDLRLSAPLTAITAAVVGVILSLALSFAQHCVWPQGGAGPIDVAAVVLAALAAVALIRFKRGTVEVLVVCAGLGLLHQWAI